MVLLVLIYMSYRKFLRIGLNEGFADVYKMCRRVQKNVEANINREYKSLCRWEEAVKKTGKRLVLNSRRHLLKPEGEHGYQYHKERKLKFPSDFFIFF